MECGELPQRPEFSPFPQPEKVDHLKKFIQQGLELIKSRRTSNQ